jgi:hypothetical protein
MVSPGGSLFVAVGEEIANIVAGIVDHLNKGTTTPSRHGFQIEIINPRDCHFIFVGFSGFVQQA